MPYNIMIKPTSSACNLRCKYCFYHDEAENRQVPNYGMMSIKTADVLLKKFLSSASGHCAIAFQGGEPMLRGLDFYEEFIGRANAHNKMGIKISYSMQTNGTLIDEKWAQHFKEHGYLLGVSIDGTSNLHDTLRRDSQNGGTFEAVTRGISHLDKEGVPYNILTVVTRQLCDNAKSVFKFYAKNGWRHHQYIPCLEPLNEVEQNSYAPNNAEYARFLKDLFDIWYLRITANNYVSIRMFDNLVYMFAGQPSETCTMAGVCGVQYMVESGGNVYPCDFYGTDEWILGNILENSIKEIDMRRDAQGFVQTSNTTQKECASCKWFALCRGGCKRERKVQFRYCEAYKEFFAYVNERLAVLAKKMV